MLIHKGKKKLIPICLPCYSLVYKYDRTLNKIV